MLCYAMLRCAIRYGAINMLEKHSVGTVVVIDKRRNVSGNVADWHGNQTRVFLFLF